MITMAICAATAIRSAVTAPCHDRIPASTTAIPTMAASIHWALPADSVSHTTRPVAAIPATTMSAKRTRGRAGRAIASSALTFFQRHVGRLGVLHADDVVARIHVVDLAGDGRRHVRHEIERRLADLVLGDGAAQR